MPQVFSGKDQELSVQTKFAGIRRWPLLQFLPYFSNLSKPKLKLSLFLDDPKNEYEVGKISIQCLSGEISNRPEGWDGTAKLGHEFEVTLGIITQSGVLDYDLIVPLYYLDKEGAKQTVWRGRRILNTGTIQSSEAWFMNIIWAIAGAIGSAVITSIIWWLFRG